MQYAYIFIAIFTLFSEQLGKAFKSKEVKLLAVSLVAYVLYQKTKSSELKDEAKKTSEGLLAIRLNDAFHPYLNFKIPFLGYLSDGTNETLVKSLALEIGKTNTLAKVKEAYKILYEIDLDEELISEGVLELFTENYKAGLAGKTPVSVPSTIFNDPVFNGTVSGNQRVNATGLKITVGDKYIVKGGVNLRDTKNPYPPLGTTSAGEVYQCQAHYKLTLKGVTYQVAKVNYMLFGYLPSPTDYFIVINAFTAKA
jgi:hypothetical protein